MSIYLFDEYTVAMFSDRTIRELDSHASFIEEINSEAKVVCDNALLLKVT